jgi:hypothetical protein
MGVYLNEFTSIEVALKKANEKLLGDFSKTLSQLTLNWNEIVGPQLSQITFPVKIRQSKDTEENKNILEVRVKEQNYLEVQYKKHILVEKINLYFGFSLVKVIKIIKT